MQLRNSTNLLLTISDAVKTQLPTGSKTPRTVGVQTNAPNTTIEPRDMDGQVLRGSQPPVWSQNKEDTMLRWKTQPTVGLLIGNPAMEATNQTPNMASVQLQVSGTPERWSLLIAGRRG